MKKLLPFEKKVLSGLEKCGINPDSVNPSSPLGIAVSGGADSVSLLLSLSAIFEASSLRVITVNHGIRSKNESGADAEFVKSLCASLGVKCKIISVENGKIAEEAHGQKRSVEELARKIRYDFFENFIKDENLLSLCLAHNQNDQLETLLMRFLQGSAGEGAGGIAHVRGRFSRPLLEITRSEIEAYLNEKGQVWRTDSTNSDTKYLRNRVRNLLIPVLNENFAGWQKALLAGAKKNVLDEDFIKNHANLEFFKKSEKRTLKNERIFEIDRHSFYNLHDALKRRVFFSALNEAGFGSRFPYRLFEEIASWENQKNREIQFENLKILLDAHNLVIFRVCECQNNGIEDESFVDGGFSFLFKKTGDKAKIGETVIEIEENGNLFIKSEKNVNSELRLKISLPCLVRTPVSGDKILTSDGKFKTLAHIFSDWKLPENIRAKVFVIEELSTNEKNASRISAVLASPFGFKNWIVDFQNL